MPCPQTETFRPRNRCCFCPQAKQTLAGAEQYCCSPTKNAIVKPYRSEAPTLRALWKDQAIQGSGSGLLVWLQWTDMDQQTTGWKGRYLIGQAPVRTRQQHRAFLVPFENGIPILNQPGRHGDVVVDEINSEHVRGTIHSDRIEGPFEARHCAGS